MCVIVISDPKRKKPAHTHFPGTRNRYNIQRLNPNHDAYVHEYRDVRFPTVTTSSRLHYQAPSQTPHRHVSDSYRNVQKVLTTRLRL